ncbi:MAG: hypothetical protein IJE46_05480 [Clostridia bacterium]|nr:hypothetical protein [Clostridia bacterium]
MKKAVYTSKGCWQFYYNEGIRCIFPDGSDEMLFQEGLDDFDITADGQEKIYMLCQDSRNYFYLYWFDGLSWQNKCMLESSTTETYNKNFYLVNVGGWLNAFYTVKHNESTLIVHHIIYGDAEPEIIEKSECFKSYFALSDKYGNLYCFMARGTELGYKKYMWNEKRWSKYKGIFKFNEEINYISAAFDENNNYHVAVCIGEDKKYKIAYTSERKTHEIISGGYSVLKPVIVIKDNIHILFDFAGRVLQAVSLDGGDSFLDAKYFFPGSFKKQGIVKIISSNKIGEEIKTDYTYGYETEYGKLVPSLIEENINKIEKPKIDEPTEIQPEIENFIETEETKSAPPPDYKKEENTDTLYAMISKLAKRIDEIESKLFDSREIKIVQNEDV